MNSTPEYPLELEVVAARSLTEEIRHLVLRRVDGGVLPPFEAGAHVDLCVQLGQGVKEKRSYSLINSEDTNGQYEIAVKRERDGRGGSHFMHTLVPGQRVRCKEPNNQFKLASEPQYAVLIAGGIGITPILSMARTLQARGIAFEMHYGARHPDLMAFQEEVMRATYNKAQLYFDRGPTQRAMDLTQILLAHEPQRHVYVCGPKPLLDAVRQHASDIGWPEHHVHFEVFGSVAQTGDQPFTLMLQKSSRTLHVPARKSILDAMIEAGLDPMFDCKRGECGTCAVKVLSGAPDHRDYALSASDREEDCLMCICVSRCTSGTLTLDA